MPNRNAAGVANVVVSRCTWDSATQPPKALHMAYQRGRFTRQYPRLSKAIQLFISQPSTKPTSMLLASSANPPTRIKTRHLAG